MALKQNRSAIWKDKKKKYHEIAQKFDIFESKFEAVRNWTSARISDLESGLGKIEHILAYLPEMLYAVVAVICVGLLFKICEKLKFCCEKRKKNYYRRKNVSNEEEREDMMNFSPEVENSQA